MIGSLLAAALLLQAAPPGAAAAPSHAALEVETDRAEVYVGEPVPIRIRVILDRAGFEERAVPLTLRRTDVPVLVEAPWLHGLRAPPGAAGATLALGDATAATSPAPRKAGEGRLVDVYLVERLLVPDRPGPLVLAAPRLRWAEAERLETDALGEAVPRGRREFSVEGNALALTVLPVPPGGPPGGAAVPVGRFALRVAADRAEAPADGTVRLTLTVTGDGDPETFPEPDPSTLRDFHVLGRRRGPAVEGGRSWFWDLSPLRAGDLTLGPLAYPHFDPTPPARHAAAVAETLHLRVLPGAGAAASPPVADPAKPGTPWLPVAAAAAVLLAILLAALRPRRRDGPTS